MSNEDLVSYVRANPGGGNALQKAWNSPLVQDAMHRSGTGAVLGGFIESVGDAIGGFNGYNPVRNSYYSPIEQQAATWRAVATVGASVLPGRPALPGKLGNAGSADLGTLRGMGSRGVRNTELLTPTQEQQLYQHVAELGLNPDDFLVSTHVSAYSDNWDKVFLGPNMFRATEGTGMVNSVFESMTPRAAVAHEAGHMITTRAGLDFEAGSLFDEVNASLTGRNLPGLNGVERYQLLRDAAERARLEGQKLRDVLDQMQAKRNGR